MLTVIEAGGNRRVPQKVVSSCSSSAENCGDTERAQLIDALSDLHNLLEDFSPTWYTQRFRDKAESALHVKKKQLITSQLDFLPTLTMHVMDSKSRFGLTQRDERTVSLVTEGLDDHEIARRLNIKENTVKKCLLRVYHMLGVSNRVELVLYVLSHWQNRASEE